jgi:biopolymer transport protein ExbD
MSRSGFIVRFVDVVLILLFGFISISSIRATTIDLPDSTETPPPPPALEEVLFVAIRPDGAYLVNDERTVITGGNALYEFLTGAVNAMGDVPIKVHIRASHDTPMGYLIDVARICDVLGVAKAFEVQLPAEGA